jgi:hypothetical protein
MGVRSATVAVKFSTLLMEAGVGNRDNERKFNRVNSNHREI